jgi:tetratricopeptide (TPR) repeat protein
MIPYMFRSVPKNLWSYLTIKYAVIFCLCIWSIKVQTEYRVPTRFFFLLVPWIGAALSVLSFILLVNHLLIRIPTDHPFRKSLGRIEWWASLLIVVFIYYSLLLYINGALDRSASADQPFEITEIVGQETNLGLPISYTWANLQSRHNPQKAERILLNRGEQQTLWAGEVIIARTHQGFLHFPWISKIDRDEEKYCLEIIKVTPTASLMWIRLINFYLEHQRWKEVVETTHEYLNIYPDADMTYKIAVHAASVLNVLEQYDKGMPILNYAVVKRPTYDTYVLIGWGASRQGDNARATEALQTAIRLDPERWEAYFHLGNAYKGMGRYAEASEMFKKVLKRQPHIPLVQSLLLDLQSKIISHQPSHNK